MGSNTDTGTNDDIEHGGGSPASTGGAGREIIELNADELYGDVDRVIDRTSGNDGNDGSGVDGSRTRNTKRTSTRTSGRSTATKRGSTAKKQNPSSVNTVEHLLHSIHFMVAKGIKVQELELTKEEAAKLAEAIHAVQVEYDFVVDPKVVAWGGLIGTASAIYMPRVMAYKIRMQMEAKKIAAEKQMEVLHATTT